MKEFFHGAYDVVHRDGAWIPTRFTTSQLSSLEALHLMYERFGRCAAGVSLALITSALEIGFSWTLSGLYTRTGGFDVYENGVLVHTEPLPPEPASGRFTYRKESPGDTLLEIFLPAYAACALSVPSFGDAKPLSEDGKPFYLFYGDSITQSAYTPTPSLSFPTLVSRMAGARYINRGIGSLYFDESTLDPDDTCRPDVIFVEYGANDLVRRENREVVYIDGQPQYYGMSDLPHLLGRADAYMAKLRAIYPYAKVYVLSTPWAANPVPEERHTVRESYREGIRALTAMHTFCYIDGRTLTPHLPSCRAEDGLHFNALGGVTAAQSLYSIVRS
ncbi:MAG: SGNH/GDSL hydrolase family protein [Clostridiaceae bacterium]|nr:SGNH/GDSL hydrolase family protein [Clostridiaceae bacterium]